MRRLSPRESQLASFEVLKIVDSICRENGMQYYLAYGSLIGAVRHQGFIPWDDDIDIVMPRDDYERLMLWFRDHADKHKTLYVVNPDTYQWCTHMITRIADNRYTAVYKDDTNGYDVGAFIDIYPYDGVGNTRAEANKTLWTVKLLCRMFGWSLCKHPLLLPGSLFKRIARIPFTLIPRIIGSKRIYHMTKNFAKRRKYTDSKYIGCAQWFWKGESIKKREWFDESVEMTFEGIQCFVPNKFDIVLRSQYGDYMKLPPENERIGHHKYSVFMKENE